MLSETSNSTINKVRRMRPLMGTLCVIEVTGSDDGAIKPLTDIVNGSFRLMQQVETLMHPLNGSDLRRINECVGKVLSVHPYTWQVLRLAKDIHKRSHGVFDPCLPISVGTMNEVELLNADQVICHLPVAIDLGGIAKGFAIDLAVEYLRRSGCNAGTVNAGGDVHVFGESQLLHINCDNDFFDIELRDQSLAVSAVAAIDRPTEHQGYYLRGTNAVPLYRRVAIKAAQVAIADALTKCVMLDGPNCKLLCDHFAAEVVIAQR